MAEPSKVIHIRNVGHEISESELLQVVQPFGTVAKLVMLRAKNQALVQMEDLASAVNAIQYYNTIQPSYQSRQSAIQAYGALHGRNIYDGCCQLDIQYSNLTELQVNYNNDRSRDFTNPSLPTEQHPRSSQPSYNDPSGLFGFQQPGDPYAQMGKAAMIAAAFGGTLPPGVSGINDRCTLVVSNLNADKIDEDKLFNLFSMYGNIVRIKILKNKPDHALIQMADGLQAELAVHYLKGATLFGKKLEVNYSKYPTVTPDPDARDYSTSHLNRFNSNVVKNYRHCCAPTKMIHISALPQDITEDSILSLVGEHGTIVNSRLFETNGKTQALVLFESVEEATDALVEKHASKLDRTNIRISFSQMQNI